MIIDHDMMCFCRINERWLSNGNKVMFNVYIIIVKGAKKKKILLFPIVFLLKGHEWTSDKNSDNNLFKHNLISELFFHP